MVMELIGFMRDELQKEFEGVVRLTNKGEYKPVKMYIGSLPDAEPGAEEFASILFLPMAGADENSEERVGLKLVFCVYVPEDGNISESEEASRDLMNALSITKNFIRKHKSLNEYFRYSEGSLSWSYIEDYPNQTGPAFYAAINVEYRTPIISEVTKAEVKAYGSSYE